jgi:hypothetical protein
MNPFAPDEEYVTHNRRLKEFAPQPTDLQSFLAPKELLDVMPEGAGRFAQPALGSPSAPSLTQRLKALLLGGQSLPPDPDLGRPRP